MDSNIPHIIPEKTLEKKAQTIPEFVEQAKPFAKFLQVTLPQKKPKSITFSPYYIEIDNQAEFSAEGIQQKLQSEFVKRITPNHAIIKFQDKYYWYANNTLLSNEPIDNQNLINEIGLLKSKLQKEQTQSTPKLVYIDSKNNKQIKMSGIYNELHKVEEKTNPPQKPEETYIQLIENQLDKAFSGAASDSRIFNDLPKIPSLDQFIHYLNEEIKNGAPNFIISQYILDFAFQYLLENGKIKKEITDALQSVSQKKNINWSESQYIPVLVAGFINQLILGELYNINQDISSDDPSAQPPLFHQNFVALSQLTTAQIEPRLSPNFGDFHKTVVFNQAGPNNSASSSSAGSIKNLTFQEFLDGLKNLRTVSAESLPKNIKLIVDAIAQTTKDLSAKTDEAFEKNAEALSRYILEFAELYLLSPNGYKLNNETKKWLLSIVSDANQIDFDNPDVVNQILSAFTQHTINIAAAQLGKNPSENLKITLERLQEDTAEIAEDRCDAEKDKKIPNFLKENAQPLRHSERLTTNDDLLKNTKNSNFVLHRNNNWAPHANFESQSLYYYPNLTNDTVLPTKPGLANREIFFDYIDTEEPPCIFYKTKWADGTTYTGKLVESDFVDKEYFEEIKSYKTEEKLNIFSAFSADEFKEIQALLSSISPKIKNVDTTKISAFSYFRFTDIQELNNALALNPKIPKNGFEKLLYTKDEILAMQKNLKEKGKSALADKLLSENLDHQKLAFTGAEFSEITRILNNKDDAASKTFLEKLSRIEIKPSGELDNEIGRILSDRFHIEQSTELLQRDNIRRSPLIEAQAIKEDTDAALDLLLKQSGFNETETELVKIAYSAQPKLPIQRGLDPSKSYLVDMYGIQNIYKHNNEIYLDIYLDSFKFIDLVKHPDRHSESNTYENLPGHIKLHYKLKKPDGKIARPHFELEWYEPSNSLLKEISLGNLDVEITDEKLKQAEKEEQENQLPQKPENTKTDLQAKKAALREKLNLAQQAIKNLVSDPKLTKTDRDLCIAAFTMLENSTHELIKTSRKRTAVFLKNFDGVLSQLFNRIDGQYKKNTNLVTLHLILSNLRSSLYQDVDQKITSIISQTNFNLVNNIASKIPASQSLLLKNYNNVSGITKISDEVDTNPQQKKQKKLTDSDLINYYLKEYAKIPPKVKSDLNKNSNLIIDEDEDSDSISADSPEVKRRRPSTTSASSSSSSSTTVKLSDQKEVKNWDEDKSHIIDWMLSCWDKPLLKFTIQEVKKLQSLLGNQNIFKKIEDIKPDKDIHYNTISFTHEEIIAIKNKLREINTDEAKALLEKLPVTFSIPMDDLIILKETFSYTSALTTQADAEIAGFEHSLKITNALQHFQSKLLPLQALKNQAAENPLVDFYQNTMTQLRKAHGEIKTYIYFDSKISSFNEDNNPSNSLIKFITSPTRNNNPLTFNLNDFIVNFNQSFDGTFKGSGFFEWINWAFDDTNWLKEKITGILKEKMPLSYYEKIQDIRQAAENMVDFWNSTEAISRYYSVAFKAELSCLLKDFSEGRLDEPGLLITFNQMEKFYEKKLVNADANLLAQLKEVRQKFETALDKNETLFEQKQSFEKSDPQIVNKYQLKSRISLTLDKLIKSYTEMANQYRPASRSEREKGMTDEREQEVRKREKLVKYLNDIKTHKDKVDADPGTDIKNLKQLQLNAPRQRF